MSIPDAGMKPQDTTNFLLGGMQKQLEAIALEQNTARKLDDDFRSESRLAISGLRSDVDILKSKQMPRTPWYAVVTGVGGFGAIALSVITLLKVLNP